jgi:starch synthase (maltosyl-transferring)
MIRLALCITDLDVGGAERAMVELALRIDRTRFTPVVYCLASRPADDAPSLVPALEGAGVEVHCLGARRAWQLFPTVRRLGRLLASQRPDLVQTFLFHANLVGRLAARRAGVPRVVSGIRVAEPRRWHAWAERLTAGRVDRYVCVSRAVADFAARRMKLDPDKLRVIPNGIDVRPYEEARPAGPDSLGLPPGRRLVTCVGRLDLQKGVDLLVESAGRWLARVPDCDLLLVGRGPLESRLRERCRAVGIAGRVVFPGWRADVPAVLAASRLAVLPSRWEGMPNILLEAMAAGLPVVATDVAGVREVLGPLADAQVVPPEAPEALTQRIVRLLTDPDHAAKLGQKNRERVRNEFPIGRTVRAYEDLWHSLVGG